VGALHRCGERRELANYAERAAQSGAQKRPEKLSLIDTATDVYSTAVAKFDSTGGEREKKGQT